MYGRVGLERFKKAQTLEPFSVNSGSSQKVSASKPHTSNLQGESQNQYQVPHKAVGLEVAAASGVPPSQGTQVGGGQSTWQPPDWAIEPRPGVYYLEVLKDREVVGKINLDRRRHIFGRQVPVCDFVLDHQSISRQHAAVVPHKNGSIYVVDLGSVHGTFVANERLSKDNPVELEVGQSLRFAASTRIYVLRKNIDALLPPRPTAAEINLPPPPDPSDDEAVLAYNTLLNRYGFSKPGSSRPVSNLKISVCGNNGMLSPERAAKKMKRTRVAFRDQVGGMLSEVVGISDGADVETEPGPVGVKEGSLVGKYESLVQITVIPKGKEQTSLKEEVSDQKDQKGAVTDKLKEILNKVKSAPKGNGIYDDLYGESFPDKVGSSWAFSSVVPDDGKAAPAEEGNHVVDVRKKPHANTKGEDNDSDDDDLFGDS